MGYLDLIVQFESEFVQKLFLQDSQNYQWRFIIQCQACKNEHQNAVEFTLQDEVEKTKADKSTANFFMKCKECKYEMSINIYEKSQFAIQANNDGKQKGVFASFECRNVNLVKWIYEQGISVQASESSTVFQDCDLTDLWCDYDEVTQNNCQIENFKFSIEKNTKLK